MQKNVFFGFSIATTALSIWWGACSHSQINERKVASTHKRQSQTLVDPIPPRIFIKIGENLEMQNTEVTQYQWFFVMKEADRFGTKNCPENEKVYITIKNQYICYDHPAIATPSEIKNFLKKFNSMFPSSPYYYSLPSYQEWRQVAEQGQFTCDDAWCPQCGASTYQQVGTKRANPLGFYDLFGNAPELLRDQQTIGKFSEVGYHVFDCDFREPFRHVNKNDDSQSGSGFRLIRVPKHLASQYQLQW